MKSDRWLNHSSGWWKRLKIYPYSKYMLFDKFAINFSLNFLNLFCPFLQICYYQVPTLCALFLLLCNSLLSRPRVSNCLLGLFNFKAYFHVGPGSVLDSHIKTIQQCRVPLLFSTKFPMESLNWSAGFGDWCKISKLIF